MELCYQEKLINITKLRENAEARKGFSALILRDTTYLHANKNDLVKKEETDVTEETWENSRVQFLNRRNGI